MNAVSNFESRTADAAKRIGNSQRSLRREIAIVQIDDGYASALGVQKLYANFGQLETDQNFDTIFGQGSINAGSDL